MPLEDVLEITPPSLLPCSYQEPSKLVFITTSVGESHMHEDGFDQIEHRNTVAVDNLQGHIVLMEEDKIFDDLKNIFVFDTMKVEGWLIHFEAGGGCWKTIADREYEKYLELPQ